MLTSIMTLILAYCSGTWGAENRLRLTPKHELIISSGRIEGMQQSGDIPVKDIYASPDYGFSIRIPDGFVGMIPPPPLPQHGIRIYLSRDHEEFIWVNGSYNAAEYTSAQEDISKNLGWLKTEGEGLEVLAKVPTHLQYLSAKRIMIRYRKKGSGERMIEDYVAALRGATNGTETGVCYELGLISRSDNYETNKQTFDQVLHSWQARKPK